MNDWFPSIHGTPEPEPEYSLCEFHDCYFSGEECSACELTAENTTLRAQLEAKLAFDPEDIRNLGWAVAIHNDYRILMRPHTFWLFTKDGRAVKGEGRTDTIALNEVRAQLANVLDGQLGGTK